MLARAIVPAAYQRGRRAGRSRKLTTPTPVSGTPSSDPWRMVDRRYID